jgi:cyclase
MIDDKTVVIPGHGPLSNKLELIAYRVKIGEAVSRIEALKRQGKTLEEAVAANPLDGMAPAEGFNIRDSIVRAYWQALQEN